MIGLGVFPLYLGVFVEIDLSSVLLFYTKSNIMKKNIKKLNLNMIITGRIYI